MDTWLWVLGSIVAVLAVLLGLPWFADRMTRSGHGGGPSGSMGILQEVFDPGAHRARIELVHQYEQKQGSESGDGDDDKDGDGELLDDPEELREDGDGGRPQVG